MPRAPAPRKPYPLSERDARSTLEAMSETIVILTGAGISAESGLGTFRDEEGLWVRHRIEDVATPEGFARNPELVNGFYNARRKQAAAATPNAAHHALARLEREYEGDVFIVTQNVDGLHEAAGSQNILHMHGSLARALCNTCGHRWDAPPEIHPGDPCPRCAATACRPDVVWFGEIPYGMHTIEERLAKAAHFVAIGTSGQVYPAAGFVAEANRRGIPTTELTLDPSQSSAQFDTRIFGKASETVPAWVDEQLS